MRKILLIATALLMVAGMSIITAAVSQASVCQPDGTGCTKAGTYPGPNAVINQNWTGFSVTWTESVVQPYTSGVPLYWTAYLTYTNVTSGTLTLGCPGSWPDPTYVQEHMSGGSGDDGTVPAQSTTCSQDAGLAVPIKPGGSYTMDATFHNVPWPGSAVSITWGGAGTSAVVYPFGNTPAPNPSPSSPSPSPKPKPKPKPISCGTGGCLWSGWGTSVRQDYTGISGDFQVPKVTGRQNGTVAIWDGLGGTSCSDALEQIGVAASIVNGKAIYRAWWEVIYSNLDFHSYCWQKQQAANNPHYFAQTVKPGDWIQVSVTYSSQPVETSGTYWLSLSNVSRGWSVKVPVTARGLTGSTVNIQVSG